MNLHLYRWIIVNSSAGKDSQAMLDYIVELADAAAYPRSRIVVAHADLGRMEWRGTRDLAAEQAAHYGLRFEVMTRAQGDLLQHVIQRGKWPSSAARYCTSDHKRGQIGRLITRLGREAGSDCQILNCMGMRAQESPSRAKLEVVKLDARNSCATRTVTTWLPIHSWTVDEVWRRIRASGVRHHHAYDLGMPRLSCCFCIFSPRAALLLAGKHNPELLNDYVAAEEKIGHTFRKDFRIAEIKSALASGEEPGRIQDWQM